MTDDITYANRPLPRRPRWGWLAWEATIGYIVQHHSPDATLKIEIYPMPHIIGWSATITWGDVTETVTDCHSFADVMGRLWLQVESSHDIFLTPEAVFRRPTAYADDDWLDGQTYEALSRLVGATDTVFSGDWLIVMIYRPIEVAEKRLQARLIAQNSTVNRSGAGPTLRDVCRSLYHNAVPVYQQYRNQE